MTQPERDALDVLTNQIAALRKVHAEVVRAELAKLSIYVPRMLLEQAQAVIDASANGQLWGAELAGEKYAHQRKTVPEPAGRLR